MDASSQALALAQMWGKLPPEHLEIALKALEPELQRDYELRSEQIRQEASKARHAHIQHLCGLWVGALISGGMLGGAVFVGMAGQPWLAALLAGPSLLALARIFVLRKSDAADVTAAGRAGAAALGSLQPPP